MKFFTWLHFLQQHCYFSQLCIMDLQYKPLFLRNMKFLFFILGSLMLYMSCLPCGDSRDCNVRSAVNISKAGNHQNHGHQSETCTPFCTCSCCTASAFYTPFIKYQVSKVVFQSEKYPLYNVAFNAEAHYAIWQPPQLS